MLFYLPFSFSNLSKPVSCLFFFFCYKSYGGVTIAVPSWRVH